MVIAKTADLARDPTAKRVEFIRRELGGLGDIALCEVMWEQPFDGYQPGEKAICYLADANILKRNGLKVKLRLIENTEAVKVTYLVQLKGNCNEFNTLRLDEAAAADLAVPRKAKKVSE